MTNRNGLTETPATEALEDFIRSPYDIEDVWLYVTRAPDSDLANLAARNTDVILDNGERIDHPRVIWLHTTTDGSRLAFFQTSQGERGGYGVLVPGSTTIQERSLDELKLQYEVEAVIEMAAQVTTFNFNAAFGGARYYMRS